ncbi:MAG TPA: hypothetical protein VF782_12295 [Allosphingosinicella sp.]
MRVTAVTPSRFSGMEIGRERRLAAQAPLRASPWTGRREARPIRAHDPVELEPGGDLTIQD